MFPEYKKFMNQGVYNPAAARYGTRGIEAWRLRETWEQGKAGGYSRARGGLIVVHRRNMVGLPELISHRSGWQRARAIP